MRQSVLFSFAAIACASAGRQNAEYTQTEGASQNPIRKVVTMLQSMQKKVTAEGEKEKDLHEKFLCYCKKGSGGLSESISGAETKIPQVTTDAVEAESRKKQTEEALKQSQSDRASAKDAMAEATSLREKEAASYAGEKSMYDTNIAAINKAVASLEKGMTGGFLQTSAANVIRQLVLSSQQDMLDVDRQAVLSFLSGTQGAGYAPKSGEITGILKELGDEMSKSLAETTGTEQAAIKTFGELMNAKKKEVAACTSSIESKTKLIGDLGVAIVRMREDLDDTEQAMAEDKKFLADLQTDCAAKKANWDEVVATRAQELAALADTIRILNDDDALDLFKATLPSSSSFLQVRQGGAVTRNRALTIVKGIHGAGQQQDRVQLDLIALALKGKRAGFDKVIKMIDNMVGLLKEEQANDDNKKEYCAGQFDTTDDKKKSLERSVSDEESAIATAEEGIAKLKEEIAALEAGIKALDKSVTDATEQRKEENKDFTDLMASDTAAKKLIHLAKNRLNKFYNPGLYKAPEKVQLSDEDQIVAGITGTMPPTPAPGGIANTGVTVMAQVSADGHIERSPMLAQVFAHGKDAPPPAPEAVGSYATKSGEGNGVIAMMDLLVKDLDKEMTEAKTAEKDAQADYEKLMSDSAEKRGTDSKSLTSKGGAKADMELELEAHKGEKTASSKELMATLEYISSLHAECDWLVKYFDVRKEARVGEIDSLTQAKGVLSGADYSLL